MDGEQEHVNESVNTFRFATQVSSVQLGTGKHQVLPSYPGFGNTRIFLVALLF